MRDERDLFTYHPASNIDPQRFLNIRSKAKELAETIKKDGGNWDDQDRAIEKLRECVFYAIASIAIPEVED